MGDVGVAARQRQVMLRVTGRRRAHLLLCAGIGLIVAGAWLLAGLGWSLLAAGVLVALYALLLVDVSPAVPGPAGADRVRR